VPERKKPREGPSVVIGQSAYAFVLVHNHPSSDSAPSEADIRLTRRLAEGARILQINMADHVMSVSLLTVSQVISPSKKRV
jgi:DNA repair protein RadC